MKSTEEFELMISKEVDKLYQKYFDWFGFVKITQYQESVLKTIIRMGINYGMKISKEIMEK